MTATDLSRDLDPRTLPVRFSHLKKIGKSPADYLHGLTEDRDTRPMRVGLGAHAKLLSGDYVVWHGEGGVDAGKDGERKGNAWKDFALRNHGKRILTTAEDRDAETIARAVRRHPEAMRILVGAHEEEIDWTWQGRACRSHLDVHRKREKKLAELKITNDSSPAAFAGEQRGTYFRPGQALTMGYHAQLAFYREALLQAQSWWAEDVYVVAVESGGAHNVVVYRLDEAALAAGRAMWVEWMAKLVECERTGKFFGYVTEMQTITVGSERLVLSYDDEAAA